MIIGLLVAGGVLALAFAFSIGLMIGDSRGEKRADTVWGEMAEKWNVDLARPTWTPADRDRTPKQPSARESTVELLPAQVAQLTAEAASPASDRRLAAAQHPTQAAFGVNDRLYGPGTRSSGRHASPVTAIPTATPSVGRHRAPIGPITQEFARITADIAEVSSVH